MPQKQRNQNSDQNIFLPLSSAEKSETIGFRVPRSWAEKLAAKAATKGQTKAELLRDVLRQYLDLGSAARSSNGAESIAVSAPFELLAASEPTVDNSEDFSRAEPEEEYLPAWEEGLRQKKAELAPLLEKTWAVVCDAQVRGMWEGVETCEEATAHLSEDERIFCLLECSGLNAQAIRVSLSEGWLEAVEINPVQSILYDGKRRKGNKSESYEFDRVEVKRIKVYGVASANMQPYYLHDPKNPITNGVNFPQLLFQDGNLNLELLHNSRFSDGINAPRAVGWIFNLTRKRTKLRQDEIVELFNSPTLTYTEYAHSDTRERSLLPKWENWQGMEGYVESVNRPHIDSEWQFDSKKDCYNVDDRDRGITVAMIQSMHQFWLAVDGVRDSIKEIWEGCEPKLTEEGGIKEFFTAVAKAWYEWDSEANYNAGEYRVKAGCTRCNCISRQLKPDCSWHYADAEASLCEWLDAYAEFTLKQV